MNFDFLRSTFRNGLSDAQLRAKIEENLAHISQNLTVEDLVDIMAQSRSNWGTLALLFLTHYQRDNYFDLDVVRNAASWWINEMGFDVAIARNTAANKKPTKNRLPIRVVHVRTKENTKIPKDSIWQNIKGPFDTVHGNVTAQYGYMLKNTVLELIQNVSDHTLNKTCSIAAQYYGENNELEFTISSAGTISQALVEAGNKGLSQDIIARGRIGAEQLFFAVLPGFTSAMANGVCEPQQRSNDTSFARGIALFRLSELGRNCGAFFIASGQHAIMTAQDIPSPIVLDIPAVDRTIISFRLGLQDHRLIGQNYRYWDERAVNWFRANDVRRLAPNESWSNLYDRYLQERIPGAIA